MEMCIGTAHQDSQLNFKRIGQTYTDERISH